MAKKPLCSFCGKAARVYRGKSETAMICRKCVGVLAGIIIAQGFHFTVAAMVKAEKTEPQPLAVLTENRGNIQQNDTAPARSIEG